MTGHTKGLFTAYKEVDEGRCGVATSINGLNFLLATMESPPPTEAPEAEFLTACLFAAAPELLEVAKYWSNAMHLAGVWPMLNSNDPIQHALALTHAAIAKATGKDEG